MWLIQLEICSEWEKNMGTVKSKGGVGGEVSHPWWIFLWQWLDMPSSSSAWSHLIHIHISFASSLSLPECLCPVPPVRTCPHVIPAVPAFLLWRAPPCPAPFSSLVELLLSHQWSSRSITRSCWGELWRSELGSAAVMPYPNDAFDAMPWSFPPFIFLFPLPPLTTDDF